MDNFNTYTNRILFAWSFIQRRIGVHCHWYCYSPSVWVLEFFFDSRTFFQKSLFCSLHSDAKNDRYVKDQQRIIVRKIASNNMNAINWLTKNDERCCETHYFIRLKIKMLNLNARKKSHWNKTSKFQCFSYTDFI